MSCQGHWQTCSCQTTSREKVWSDIPHPADLEYWLIRYIRDPSLIYVVYANLQVFNMCRDWIAGGEGPLVTMSFKPDEVSTIPPNAPTAAAKFNFGDLPCPPSNLANYYDPKKWYDPILKSDFNFTLGHEKIKGQPIGGVPCHVAAIRDPPTEWIRMDEFSGTDFGGF